MRFLVAIDDSAQSRRALDHALAVAAAADAAVTLVHAVDPNVYEATGVPDAETGAVDNQQILDAVADAEDRGEQLLADAAELADDAGVSCETQLLQGSPVDTITEFAATGDFDGIFVGHRSLSGRYERVLGSVAKGLVESAPVPVTVVREGVGEQESGEES